jgi:hypothetical protein
MKKPARIDDDSVSLPISGRDNNQLVPPLATSVDSQRAVGSINGQSSYRAAPVTGAPELPPRAMGRKK